VGCYGSLACDYPEKAPGGDLLLKSTDGGNTWNSVLYFRRTSAGRPTESNIQTNIGMNSRFREMLAKHPDVRPAQVRAVAIGLTDNQDVYAVVPGLGFLRSTDAAKTWAVADRYYGMAGGKEVTTTDGYYSWPDSPGEMLPDPANPDHIYALSHLGYVFSTDDYGVHWDVLPIISEENYHFSDLSLVNNALYVTGSKGLFKSIDNGKTWIPTEKFAQNQPFEDMAYSEGVS